MHQVLYRKWRPKTFSSVYGQNHVTDILSYEVENDKLAHAYLFCGSRGTGKTTCAKILAKAVNCQNPINGEPCGKCSSCIGIDNESVTDVAEIDAASNNGVDDVRRIRDEVSYPPTTEKYRVYIIDEVHMLTGSAFNALLKTIEEPPSQVIFILATTEIQKLPATIVSRCRRFDFKRIPSRIIADRLLYIAKEENISITDDAALLIGRISEGGLRDAIGLMELASSGNNEVTCKRVEECVGSSGISTCSKIAQSLLARKTDVIFSIVDELYRSSKDISAFWGELVSFYRNMLIVKNLPAENAKNYLDITSEEYTEINMCANSFSMDELYYHSRILDDAYIQMQKNVVNKRLCAEFALIRISEAKEKTEVSLASRVAFLEREINMLKQGTVRINKVENDPIASNVSTLQDEVKTETVKPKETQGHTFSEYAYWSEIISELKNTNPGEVSFIEKSSAMVDENGVLYISTDCGTFGIDRVNKDTFNNKIIKISEGYEYPVKGVVYKLVSRETKEKEDPINDF